MSTNSRNRHLNFYQFYTQAEEIENNLTRALAICLQNNPLFFKTFVSMIVGNTVIDTLLNHVEDKEEVYINIQEKTADIRNRQDEISKLFGVALTTDKINLALEADFQPEKEQGSSITDLVILIKDVAIIIEAKPNGQDCSAQLKKQLEECGQPLEKVAPPVSLTWEQVLEMLISTENIYRVLGGTSVHVRDFIQLIETYYVDWLPVLPFSNLPFPENEDKESLSKHYKRLEQVKNAMGVELLQFPDRTAIPTSVPWASEVIPYFEHGKQNTLSVHIWPGNTKGQGWSLYSKDQSWQTQTTLEVGEYSFDLVVIPEVSFRHARRFVSCISLPSGRSPVHNRANHSQISGKWGRERWPELVQWLDRELSTLSPDWRSDCQWHENFEASNRTHLTLALGFEVAVKVPYEFLEKLDTRKNDPSRVVELLFAIKNALEGLVT